MNEEIVSNIALLVFWVLMLMASYILTLSIDKSLHIRYRLIHVDDRPTMKIKRFRWLFKRYEKIDSNVIFKTTFIYQLITIMLFIGIIVSNILLYFANNNGKATIIILCTTSVVTLTIFLSRKEDKFKK